MGTKDLIYLCMLWRGGNLIGSLSKIIKPRFSVHAKSQSMLSVACPSSWPLFFFCVRGLQHGI